MKKLFTSLAMALVLIPFAASAATPVKMIQVELCGTLLKVTSQSGLNLVALAKADGQCNDGTQKISINVCNTYPMVVTHSGIKLNALYKAEGFCR